MIEIFIPKAYEIEGNVGLTATVSSVQTYKSAVLSDQELSLTESGFICAYGVGNNLLSGAVASSVLDKTNAWISTAGNRSTALLNGQVIHLAPCERYEFPPLANSAWTPLEFNKQVKYSNNVSAAGEFIGRSIVRTGRSVKIEPLSITAPVERMNELKLLADHMRQAPFYVRMAAPMGAVYCVYGWTEKEPGISYSTDYSQVNFSFEVHSTN